MHAKEQSIGRRISTILSMPQSRVEVFVGAYPYQATYYATMYATGQLIL